jgi:hypothetical protein
MEKEAYRDILSMPFNDHGLSYQRHYSHDFLWITYFDYITHKKFIMISVLKNRYGVKPIPSQRGQHHNCICPLRIQI